MTTTDLLVEIKNGVAVLTLNRPEKLNALTREMTAAAKAALREFIHDDGVGAILLTGAGRGFCSGGDVGAMATRDRGEGEGATLEERINQQWEGHDFPRMLHQHPKVVIAALNGATAGAGLGIALACDLRLAADTAKFTTAFANVGFGGDYGVTWGLTHTVGPARAKEMLFLAEPITAGEALHMGLVNRVAPAEKLMDEAMALAERIAAGPRLSYRYMKGNVNLAVTSDYPTMLNREAETHLRCGQSADHREGVAAFLEKRKPVFTGR